MALGIPLSFPPGGGPTDVDAEVDGRVNAHLAPRPWLAEVLTLPSNTWIVLSLLLCGAAWFAWQRRWWETGAMLLVPQLAIAANAWVLKPAWGRPLHDYLAYPSGHTVYLVSTAAIFVLMVESWGARAILVLVTVAACVTAGIGMIGMDYHHATDIAGGAGAAVALVVPCYWLVLAVRAQLTRAGSGSLPGGLVRS